MDMSTDPVFEIIDGDKTFKIWRSGKVEGFGNPVIINRLPAMLQTALGEYQPEDASAVTLLVSRPGEDLHKLHAARPGTASNLDIRDLIAAVAMFAADRYPLEEGNG